MNQIAFQDAYPDDLSHCFGCGKNNPQGHQLKSYWHEQGQEFETTIAHFTPESYHTAIPGFVYARSVGIPDRLPRYWQRLGDGL